ncbi:MAG TPA: polysaccharide deacetylase family protein [Rugosimonospora sp.]|nr:polysaccharide deacetylase family protein [Rugosimonospora sp.]
MTQVLEGPDAVPVLMYHSVSRVAEGPMRPLAVPQDLFREQLGTLAEAGYQLVGLSEALDVIEEDPGALVAAVTFDDGYLDFLRHALPVLTELGARATLYLPVSHVGRSASWLGLEAETLGPLLTWAQVHEVKRAGIEIGNHGLVHHPLDVLRPAQRDREIADSQHRLAQELGRPVRSFCYPHGYQARGVRAAVARTGHDNACEIGYRLYRPGRDDRLAIPRLQPTPDHTGEDLLSLVEEGDLRLLPRVKRVARPGWRITRRVARDMFGKRLT